KRAELKKADEADLQPLRDALAAAEQALHAAEAASGKPAPELVRTERPGMDEKFKALKTEVAFARADLRKLERDESAAGEALEQARTRLAEAERKLAEYQP
ncbi:electron transport complex subunit RsxC, partial [Ectopseudomonas hydrolytica]